MKRIDQDFEVRDTNRAGNIVPHLFLALLTATPLYLALTHAPFQQMIENEPSGSLQGFITVMSLLNAAMAIDLIGLVLNLFSRQPALRLTENHVEGLYGWLRRRYAWEDVEHVVVGINHLQFVRRASNPLFALFHMLRPKGDKRRAVDQISLKLATADRDLGQILFEIEKRCPGLEVISSSYLKSSRKPSGSETPV